MALLEQISRAYESGQIPDAAYLNLVATMGRFLKASADLTTELAGFRQWEHWYNVALLSRWPKPRFGGFIYAI